MAIGKMRLNKLRRFHFVDKDDLDVGSLEDIALNKSNLVPSYLILGSNFFEELLEEMGKRANIDEIAPIDLIEEIDGDHVIIGKSVDELEVTDEKGDLPKEYKVYKFSELKNFKVQDGDGKLDVELIDVELDGENSRFVFNYTTLHRDLTSEGYGQRFEVSYLVKDVKTKSKTIIIPATKDELIARIKETVEPKIRGKTTLYWE